ncbi:MAG: hypothetical protein AB7O44_29045 [Hyphomicrobiaceae bacterium]|jgi:hypothetical protein
MSKMNQLVGEMYARLNQIADSERALVRDLAETIRSVDLQVLQDVRTMAATHGGTRRVILTELESLADCIGTFPTLGKPTRTFADPPARPLAPVNDGQAPRAPGDWRQAVSNIEDMFKDYAA